MLSKVTQSLPSKVRCCLKKTKGLPPYSQFCEAALNADISRSTLNFKWTCLYSSTLCQPWSWLAVSPAEEPSHYPDRDDPDLSSHPRTPLIQKNDPHYCYWCPTCAVTAGGATFRREMDGWMDRWLDGLFLSILRPDKKRSSVIETIKY